VKFFVRAIVIAAALATTLAASQGQATGIVAGRVVDANGAAIPAATVMLVPGASAEGPSRSVPDEAERVLTDDAGRFVFSNIGAGTFRLQANKPGWLAGTLGQKRPGGAGTSFELGDGERRNDFAITIWRPAIIGGRVTDDAGDPLIGVEVRAIKQVFLAGRRQNDRPTRAKTDDRGLYRFPNLEPGDYIVAVLASALSEPPGFAGAIGAGQEIPPAYLETMVATGSNAMLFDRATGNVGPDKPLVASLTTLAAMPSADGAWPAYVTTYHPAATAQSSATVFRAQSGEPRTDIDVTVRLTPTWSVSGVVKDAAGPAVWHAVHLVPAESGDQPIIDVATAVTDSKGAFTLYGVPPGRYTARVVRVPIAPGGRYGLVGGTGEILQVMAFREREGGPAISPDSLWHADQPVVVSDRSIRDLAINLREGVRVRGRVRFEGARAQPTAEELKGTRVSLVPATGRADGPWYAQIAPDGRFTSASLWPGRYLVSAEPPDGWYLKDATYQGREVSTRPLDLADDLDNVVVTFTDQQRAIKGTVQVEPGAKPEEATVLLFPTDAKLWMDYGRRSRLMARTRVPASAQFSLTLPPAGDYFLVAVPEESIDQWQSPEFLSKISLMAERIRVAGDASLTQTLQLKRIR